MDWKLAIEINRVALGRIVTGLVAMLSAQGGAKRLPIPVYRAIVRLLCPAESALRRLIVVAARKLVLLLPSPRRPIPEGLVIGGKGPGGSDRYGNLTFQLFDIRKVFRDEDRKDAESLPGPRIRSVGDADPRSLFLAKFTAVGANGLCSEAERLHLGRRLEAVTRALDNLPREARRMVRWLARRAAMKEPKFTSPLRPGRPPGARKRGGHEIDTVLSECHGLARYAMAQDTS